VFLSDAIGGDLQMQDGTFTLRVGVVNWIGCTGPHVAFSKVQHDNLNAIKVEVVMATLAGTGNRLTMFTLISNSIALSRGAPYLRFFLLQEAVLLVSEHRPILTELQKQMIKPVRHRVGSIPHNNHGHHSRFDSDCDMSRAMAINITMFMHTSLNALTTPRRSSSFFDTWHKR
jgi:hypothetical protein